MVRKVFVMLAVGLISGTCLASFPYTSESYTFHVSMSSDEFQHQIQDANSQINQVLSQYGTSGASVTPYRLVAPNQAVASVYASQYGTTFTVTVINDGGGGGGSPSSSQSITTSRILRNSALDQAAPGKDPQQRRKSVPSGFRADLFYNSWEFGGDGQDKVKGYTAGITPTIMFGGETVEFTMAVPLHGSSVEDGDPVAHIGLDLAVRVWLGDYVSVGGHGALMADIYSSSGDSGDSTADTTRSINGGPFVSVRIPMGNVGIVSLAAVYETFIPDEGDTVSEIALAANVGLNMGDSAAFNVYGIQHKNTDSALSDFDYKEIGAEFVFGGGGTWALSVGAKTVVGIDDYSSVEGYVGSEWRW